MEKKRPYRGSPDYVWEEIEPAWLEMMERPRVMKKTPGVDESKAWLVYLLSREKGIISFKVRMTEDIRHKHGHMYEACFYVLEGKGYEIHDEIKYEWEAGDAFFVQHPRGCVHEHINTDPNGCKLLIFEVSPWWESMNLVADGEIASPMKSVPIKDTAIAREGGYD
jgi:mannose-6-phosphate isomerase-like protein (cupin superfamily)